MNSFSDYLSSPKSLGPEPTTTDSVSIGKDACESDDCCQQAGFNFVPRFTFEIDEDDKSSASSARRSSDCQSEQISYIDDSFNYSNLNNSVVRLSRSFNSLASFGLPVDHNHNKSEIHLGLHKSSSGDSMMPEYHRSGSGKIKKNASNIFMSATQLVTDALRNSMSSLCRFFFISMSVFSLLRKMSGLHPMVVQQRNQLPNVKTLLI